MFNKGEGVMGRTYLFHDVCAVLVQERLKPRHTQRIIHHSNSVDTPPLLLCVFM
jgi:hypothetical protein